MTLSMKFRGHGYTNRCSSLMLVKMPRDMRSLEPVEGATGEWNWWELGDNFSTCRRKWVEMEGERCPKSRSFLCGVGRCGKA
jgi:hypothetical protein